MHRSVAEGIASLGKQSKKRKVHAPGTNYMLLPVFFGIRKVIGTERLSLR